MERYGDSCDGLHLALEFPFSLTLLIKFVCALLTLQHGPYVWLTYKQVYDKVIRVGNAIRACGVEPVSNLLMIIIIMYFLPAI